ncbi:hypothetical protein [Flagellimonas sp. 2504JD4-2]
MKTSNLISLFLLSSIMAFAQLDDTSSTSNGSMTLGTGTGTLYQFAGDQRGTDGTNQSQGGFGILSGSNQISPIVWMYGYGGKNAFQVRKKGYNGTVQNGTTLFHVDVDGKVGVGTSSPDAKLHVENSAITQTSTAKTDANLIVQGTSTTRSTSEGAALGFVVPANTDGSNHWQQGRILVTPDNTNSSNASGRMYLQARYYSNGAWRWRNNLVLLSSGRVGIGTEVTGSHELAVEGSIGAREVKVEATGWSDFVFYDDYKLPSLQEVENHINENGHLKDIPSTKEVVENGFYLGEMDSKLLQKIEELTLYTIQQQKEIDKQADEIEGLKLLVQQLIEIKK